MELTVFWDIENVNPPSFLNGKEIIQRIQSSVNSVIETPISRIHEVIAIGSIDRIPAKTRRDLQNGGVVMQDCACQKPGASDIAIITEVMKHVYFKKPPSMICLISSDRDFGKMLHFLDSVGYNVIVIHKAGSSNELIYSGLTTFEWQSVMFGSDCSSNQNHNTMLLSEHSNLNGIKPKMRSIAVQTNGLKEFNVNTPTTARSRGKRHANAYSPERTSSSQSRCSSPFPSEDLDMRGVKQDNPFIHDIDIRNKAGFNNSENVHHFQKLISASEIEWQPFLSFVLPGIALIPNDHFSWFLYHFRSSDPQNVLKSETWKDIGFSSFENCIKACLLARLLEKKTFINSFGLSHPIEIDVDDEEISLNLSESGQALIDQYGLDPPKRPCIINRYFVICDVDVKFRVLLNAYIDAIEDFADEQDSMTDSQEVWESARIPYGHLVSAIKGRVHGVSNELVKGYIELGLRNKVIEMDQETKGEALVSEKSSNEQKNLNLSKNIQSKWEIFQSQKKK